jgi:membrane-associated phospholipid phosphatase
VKSIAKTLFAAAITIAATQVTTSASAQPVRDEAKKKVEWTYSRFSTGEAITTGVATAGLLGAMALMKDDDPRWRGGVLFDQAAINFGRGSSTAARERAGHVSDALLYTMTLWPFLDAGVAATAHHNPDTAWQMALVNTQSFMVTGLVTTLVKGLARRERPWVSSTCYDSNGVRDPNCRDSQSFMSGHSSTAFTGAGLVCAHHQALPLYGSKVADTAACVTAVLAASTTGALRVVADKHYASDVFAGAAIGFASGYLLPKLLHFGGWSSSTTPDKSTAKKPGTVAWTAAPMPVAGGAVMTVSGVVF